MGTEIKQYDYTTSPFDKIRHVDENGEFWWDHELGALLTYYEYRNIKSVIEKAKVACTKSGKDVDYHFVDAHVMIEIGKGAKREVSRTRLTRYAAYLSIQEADSNKEIVADGKTYFAIRTREAEIKEAQEQSLDADLRQIQQMTIAIQQTRNEQRRLAAIQEEQNLALANHAARLDSIEHNTGWLTAVAFAKLYELPYSDTSSMSKLGKRAAKITRELHNLEPRKTTDQRYGEVNLYPEKALIEASKQLGWSE